MLIFLLTIAAAVAALAGGYTAISNRHRLDIAMAITSGLVLGVVAFDLLPEIFEGTADTQVDVIWPMMLFVAGFLLFHFVEKIILVHGHSEAEYGAHYHPRLGVARAVALAGHSFFDGLSIGVAFQVDNAVGTAVALAVIGHRFADGFDTASFMLRNKSKLENVKRLMWLVIITPILGGLCSLVVSLSAAALSIYLGFFAGILMYIAAGNILPQAHSKNSPYKSMALTILGAAFMFGVTRLI